jgi:hypothetical protein
MFCNECGAQIPSSAKYCDSCGTAVGGPSGYASRFLSSPAPDSNRSFLARFIHGEYGLPITFWLFGVLVWAVYVLVEGYLVLSNGKRPSAGAIVFAFAFIAYLFLLIPAVWNAATQHPGFKIWTLLAKLVCIVWIIQLCSVVFRFLASAIYGVSVP